MPLPPQSTVPARQATEWHDRRSRPRGALS